MAEFPTLKHTVIFGITTLAVVAGTCGCSNSTKRPQLIVLGVDGMDPGFVERHWSDLPNLARLRDRGSFSRLGTTTPPQSPVAWSTFITGLAPDAHGIFDFVHRDASTLQPFSSMDRTEEPRYQIPLGPYLLPLSASRVVSLRQGTAFWKTLSDRNIPVSVIRMPTNYPPVQAGRAISGMGTPDLRGTLGTFTFYTDDPEELSRSVAGGQIVKIENDAGHLSLALEGPPNSLRKDHAFASANLTVDVDPVNPAARISVGDEMAIVREGEWSDWIAADFELIPHLVSVRGMFRVFAKQLHPRFALYVSAINIDPVSPALPVSAPASLGRAISEEKGRFYTMGIPEDTAALRQNVFTLPEFLAQTHLVFEDEHKLLRYSLQHFAEGLLFFYFSSVDQNSHMLWGKHEPELLAVYREIDGCVGEVMRQHPSAELIVMSDHGFTTFDRAVHLNAWLNHRGFLGVNGVPGDEVGLENVDWSTTDAYALGLNGLYLNIAGREKHGILNSSEKKRAVLTNVREQLLAFHDPTNGRSVVHAMYETHATKTNAGVAPDLIVGYSPGYRASWQTGLGGIPPVELEDNTDPWIGDHCIDPTDVPGVLFTSRKLRDAAPRLQDVTASVLRYFGIAPGTEMSGHPAF